jgi:hypothetical protein
MTKKDSKRISMKKLNMYCSWCSSKIFETDRTCPQCGDPTKDPIYQEQTERNSEFLDSLEPFSFIAGTDFELTFNIYDEYGTPIDLFDSEINWILSPYGRPDKVSLTLEGNVVDNGKVVVTLSERNTKYLDGKYVHQLFIDSATGTKYCANSGIITIFPRIY